MGGAVVDVLQTFITLPTISTTGQVSYQAGYTAWMSCYLNLLNWGAFPLQLPPTHLPEFSTPTSFKPFWYDNTVVLGIEVPLAQLILVYMTDNGSGYTSPPTVTVPITGGVGIQLQALLNGSGGVGDVAVNDPGFGYGDHQVLAFSGGGGSGAAGYLLVPNVQLAILVYVKPPTGYSQWSALGTGYILMGAFAFGVDTPDWAALLVAALGSSPQYLAPCNLKIVWVDRSTGLIGATTYAKLHPQGSIACIASWGSIPAPGTYHLDFSSTPIQGASVDWLVVAADNFTFTVNTPGLNGTANSYSVPVAGLSSAYNVTVAMWAAGGAVDCP
jgi:hypothetical protein